MARRVDDEAHASAAGDVAPHGVAGGLLVRDRLEARVTAGGDDRVVVTGSHLPRPELDGLGGQLAELHVPPAGEWVVGRDGEYEFLAPDRALVYAVEAFRAGREREVEPLVAEQPFDVRSECLAGHHLELRMRGGDRVDEGGKRLIHGGQGVGEAQYAGLTARRGLRATGGAIGGVECPARLLHEDLAGRRDRDTAVGPLEQLHPEHLLDRSDLLRERLLGDVQVTGGAGEASLLRDGGHVSHLPQLGRHGRRYYARRYKPRFSSMGRDATREGRSRCALRGACR